MRKILSLSLLTAFVAVAPAAQAQSCTTTLGNLVANCSFEGPTPTRGPNFQFTPTLTSWNVVGGQFERWSNSFNGFTSKDGVTHLELDSDLGNTTIWQVIATQVGYQYSVDFWTAHRSLGGQVSQIAFLTGASSASLNTVFTTPAMSDVNPGQYLWVKQTTSFVATGASTAIAFRGVGPSNTYGDHLDNVTVLELGRAQVVPEPSTYALMAAGLAGLVAVARRRRA